MVRTIQKSPVLAAPYGTSRTARIQRDMPFHYVDGVDPLSTLLKGSRVVCQKIGRRTWKCIPAGREKINMLHEWVICNTRDLTFLTSITATKYRLNVDFAPKESTYWAAQARRDKQIRWARRTLGKALRFGDQVWTDKCQSAIDDVVMDLDRADVPSDLIRAVNAAPFGAARKAKVLESVEPKYADLWYIRTHNGIFQSVSAEVQKKVLDALVTLMGAQA